MKDNVRQFIELRNRLQQEKEEIESRLKEINEALGDTTTVAEISYAEPRPVATAAPSVRRSGRGRRAGNELSLREAIIQVTSDRALTKQEIVSAVQNIGYRFTGKNPVNSVGVILYGRNSDFVNQDGRFRYGGSAASTAAPSTMRRSRRNGRARRGNISPEGRARIAAAARARWARERAKKG